MFRKTCLLGSLLLPVSALNAATIITLANGDFQGGVNGTLNPNGWTVTEANNKVYAEQPTAALTTVLHFKDIDVSTTQSSVLQNLSANNALLTAESYGDYTVTVDLGWRTDRLQNSPFTATGSATLRFSLVNLANSSVLGFTDVILAQRATPLYNTYALTENDKAINITYDNTQPGLGSASIGLLITRIDGDGVGNENESTLWMDNLSLAAVPEPSAALLGGLGLLALLRRRRS